MGSTNKARAFPCLFSTNKARAFPCLFVVCCLHWLAFSPRKDKGDLPSRMEGKKGTQLAPSKPKGDPLF
jgi:hypothetical protein